MDVYLLKDLWRQEGLQWQLPPTVTALLFEEGRYVGHSVSVRDQARTGLETPAAVGRRDLC